MIEVQLRSLKKGSIFRLHHAEGAPLWVRSSYDRSTKLYEIYPFDDFFSCEELAVLKKLKHLHLLRYDTK